jgi:hypothetical protein
LGCSSSTSRGSSGLSYGTQEHPRCLYTSAVSAVTFMTNSLILTSY